jgi:hypothetical protein
VTNNEAELEVAEPDDLYSLPYDQFTSARNRLAARFRAEGKTEEAEAVTKLRKPSVAAWALNRVAHRTPEAMKPLLDSHRRLRQSASMEALRAATEARREAVAALVEAALAELAADGRAVTAQTRDQIADTLVAVATDIQGENDLEAGRLVRSLQPTGTGWGEIGLTPPPSPSPRQQAEVAAQQARDRAERLEREAAEAERLLEQAQQTLAEAKRRAKQARTQAIGAAEEARRAEKMAGEAKDGGG